MKDIPENKDVALNYANIVEQTLNRSVLLGVFKILISISYILGMGLPLLVLVIGIGFCSIHFNFVTATLTLLFAIFLFVVNYQVDRKSNRFLEHIGERVEKLSSIYEEVHKNKKSQNLDQ